MNAKTDLRIIKTQKNIKESFISLLQRKDFSAITVQNILDEAMINRTTFYKYYDSKYKLVKILNTEIMQRFDSMLDFALQNRQTPNFMFNNLERMIGEFYTDRKTVLALWQVQAEGIGLYNDMENLMKDKYRAFLENKKEKSDNIDFQTIIMSSLLLTCFKYVLQSEEKYSIKELNIQVGKFFDKNFIKAG